LFVTTGFAGTAPTSFFFVLASLATTTGAGRSLAAGGGGGGGTAGVECGGSGAVCTPTGADAAAVAGTTRDGVDVSAVFAFAPVGLALMAARSPPATSATAATATSFPERLFGRATASSSVLNESAAGFAGGAVSGRGRAAPRSSPTRYGFCPFASFDIVDPLLSTDRARSSVAASLRNPERWSPRRPWKEEDWAPHHHEG
jgi:hypothetical protein